MHCGPRSCGRVRTVLPASGRVSWCGPTSFREARGSWINDCKTEEWHMYARVTTGIKGFGMRGLAAALLFMGATLASAQEAKTDAVLDGWLGKEFTIQTSTLNDHMPVGGKFTFIYDSDDNV